MNKIAFIIIPLLVLACSVMPPPKLIEYRGPDVYEGKGGTVETIDGIDFWSTGTPNRKFKVLGYIEYTLGNIGRKFVISKVKEVGGDGVVIVDKKTRASGIYDFMGDAHISYSTDYWMAVVKYLETGSEKLLNQGIALLKGGQYDRAIATFNDALETNPRYAEAYMNRGVAYDEKGQYDKAISDYTKAIELNPTYAWAYENRGIAYDKKGHFDEAISDYTKAIEINPRFDEAYYNRGLTYDKNGQYDKAISDYTKAIELNSKSDAALYNRGGAHFKKGEYDKAISDYTRAIEINPRLDEAYYNRGLAYAKGKGQYDKAISDCNKAIEINPGVAEAYYYRGVFHFYKKEYEKTWADVHKVQNLGLQIHPEFLKALREASGRQE